MDLISTIKVCIATVIVNVALDKLLHKALDWHQIIVPVIIFAVLSLLMYKWGHKKLWGKESSK